MFRIDNFVIDRILRAYILDGPNGNLLGYLDQLTDATIEMSSESQDVTDAQGVLIKRFLRSKSATFQATNAILNLNVMGLALGSEKINAGGTVVFNMPASVLVKAGETVKLDGYVEGSENVYGMTGSGTATVKYEKDTEAAADKYSITTAGAVTLPTNKDETNYFIYYTKHVTKDGIKWVNSADKFPASVSIVIEAIGFDVCHVTGDPEVLVISSNSFQISPDVTINISGGDSQTLDFSGDFQVSFCDSDKSLFDIYIADDQDE